MICHSNFVTSLEFGLEGQTLYSGDRTGTVAIWETIVGDHHIFKVRRLTAHRILLLSKLQLLFHSQLKKTISLSDLIGYSIESLKLHPGGRRLLIHSSSVIRLHSDGEGFETFDLTELLFAQPPRDGGFEAGQLQCDANIPSPAAASRRRPPRWKLRDPVRQQRVLREPGTIFIHEQC